MKAPITNVTSRIKAFEPQSIQKQNNVELDELKKWGILGAYLVTT